MWRLQIENQAAVLGDGGRSATEADATNMIFSEKCFWLVIGGFLATTIYGIGYQMLYREAAMATTLLPMMISLSLVHILGAWFGKDRAVTNLWIALLIWLYFPMAAACGFITAALGCDEGLITLENITSPFLLAAAIFNLISATSITLGFLRAREIDPAASILPFMLKSGIFQVALGPLLMLAFAIAK